MRSVNYHYLAAQISNISRIPVRIYNRKELVSFHDPLNFAVDPASLYIKELLSDDQNIFYFITPFSQYYGVIHHQNHTLILGPTYQVALTRSQSREFMFLLGIRENYWDTYQTLLDSITPMPLDIFLHELCLIYYFLTEEEISISDILLTSSPAPLADMESSAPTPLPAQNSNFLVPAVTHNTLDLENRMLSYVAAGDQESLIELFSDACIGQAGVMADNYLRQLKDTFITASTLVSRAAIRGGMAEEEALSLSDTYIQHCEKHSSPDAILNLQYHMVLDFASQVAQIRVPSARHPVVRGAIKYVNEHINEKISVKEIAEALFLNYHYLSSCFKNETGISLSSYIQHQKVRRAQKYLAETSFTILEISTFLGYSSQGYFQNIFKKFVGKTPGEYRESLKV